jgi:hypothetical protein
VTIRLNGRPITTLSYPALAFEAYLPLLALGWVTQAAVWVERLLGVGPFWAGFVPPPAFVVWRLSRGGPSV